MLSIVILYIFIMNLSIYAVAIDNTDYTYQIAEEKNNVNDSEDLPYSKEYLEYLQLSDEEKEKVNDIPRKEFISVHLPEEKVSLYSDMSAPVEQASTLPSKYNLKDNININVENQGATGWCWAFSSMKTLETYISKNKAQNYNLAEYHLAYMRYKYFGGWAEIKDENNAGTEAYNLGGNYNDFMKYVGVYSPKCGFMGPVTGTGDENKMYEFTQGNKNNFVCKTPVLKVTQAEDFSHIHKEYSSNGSVTYKNGNKILTDSQITAFRETIKNQIKNNGAVYAAVATPYSDRAYFNNSTYAEYYNGDTTQLKNATKTHAITVVGWDDSYSKTKFNTAQQPKNDGAYICLNSWGEGWGDGGYFYVSYDDALIEQWMSGIISAKLKSDSPNISINYSTKELTNSDVTVTITCDERIEEVSGWNIS